MSINKKSYAAKFINAVIREFFWVIMLSDFLKRLMFARQFKMLDGNIMVLGTRHVMFPISALYNLENVDKDILYTAFKDSIKEDLKHNPGILGLNDTSICQDITNVFGTTGLGKLTIVEFDKLKPKATVIVCDSDESYLTDEKITTYVIAGIIAGIFSYVLTKDIDFKQVKVGECGINSCQFEIK